MIIVPNMDIAKITYISLTVLTAWIFYFLYIGKTDVSWTILMIVWIECAAISASWLSWHYLHPISIGNYLFCGLLTAILFHVGLAIGSFCFYIGCAIFGDGFKGFFPEIGSALVIMLGAFIILLVKAGLYTLWLCLQTAVITKGLMEIISLTTKDSI